MPAPDPAWLLQFSGPDRVALRRAFQDAARLGANTPRDAVLIVKYRYIGARALASDPGAAEHYQRVLETLDTYKLEVRQWAADVLRREKG